LHAHHPGGSSPRAGSAAARPSCCGYGTDPTRRKRAAHASLQSPSCCRSGCACCRSNEQRVSGQRALPRRSAQHVHSKRVIKSVLSRDQRRGSSPSDQARSPRQLLPCSCSAGGLDYRGLSRRFEIPVSDLNSGFRSEFRFQIRIPVSDLSSRL